MTQTDQVFRLSVARFWVRAWLLFAASMLVVYGLIRWTGRELDPAAVLACGAGLAVVLTGVGWSYRVTVSAEGLRFLDFTGKWAFVAWETIEWAERTWQFGMPFLDLKVAGVEKGCGVVLLLRDPAGFRAAVAAAAGPHHPATWALMEAAPAR
jgi:hypothetical protein